MVFLTQSGGVIWLIVLLYDRPSDELDKDWGILDVTVVALLIGLSHSVKATSTGSSKRATEAQTSSYNLPPT